MLSTNILHVFLYSVKSELPFHATADEELVIKMAVYNPWDSSYRTRVAFGVRGDRNAIGLMEFTIKPKQMLQPTITGLTLRRLLHAVGRDVPPPGSHIEALWLAATRRADGQFRVDDAIVRKLIVPEAPKEGEFPLWLIPAVGGGIIALGIGVQLLEKRK
ncbi:MAG: hypothetical protein DDT26_02281 [Dehalococcoidia bacterium]|nr:hypothetical protein [Chloroflexota bacterium]